MRLDDNGLEILERDECLELLASRPIARLGLSMQALPVVLPVNFVVSGDRIMIRTSAGSKLDAAMERAVVAVEVDDIDPIGHAGWSVLVRGTSWVVDDPEEIERASHLPVRPWANDGADRWIAVSIDMISGRRARPLYETPPAPHGLRAGAPDLT